MTAKTAWFWCGKCGFKNHPRPTAEPQFVRGDDGRYDLVDGDSKCEQCGMSREHPAAHDYNPGA